MRRGSVGPETAVLLAALALLACSTGWACWRAAIPMPDSSEAGGGFHDDVTEQRFSEAVASAVSETSANDRKWERPQPQSEGPEWLYDLFTPPTIYRRAGSNEFLASPPAETKPERRLRRPDFDLLAVHPALFRLQLVGFAGEAGNFFGLFENTLTTEHFLAGTDQAIPALGVRIERFRVLRRQDQDADETVATAGLVAEALVRDETSGEEIILTDRERAYHGAPTVILGVRGAPEARFTLQQNGEIEYEGIRYRLREVHLAPPAVELIEESTAETDSEPETWTLTMTAENES